MQPDKVGAPEGNQNAVKRSRLVSDTLRKIAVQNPEKLRAACEALIDKAAEGDTSAYKELRDTLDGRPTQAITGPEGGPLEASISVNLIRKPPGIV